MSISKDTLITAAVAQYRDAGGTLADLSAIVLQAWESAAPTVATATYVDGMSQPNEFGLVRIQELDEFREQMEKEGQFAIADQIRPYYACVPALARITPGTKADATVRVATSSAQFMNGMNLAGGWRVFPAVPSGNPLRPYDTDRSQALDGAYAVPANIVTLADVVEFVKREARAVAAGPTG